MSQWKFQQKPQTLHSKPLAQKSNVINVEDGDDDDTRVTESLAKKKKLPVVHSDDDSAMLKTKARQKKATKRQQDEEEEDEEEDEEWEELPQKKRTRRTSTRKTPKKAAASTALTTTSSEKKPRAPRNNNNNKQRQMQMQYTNKDDVELSYKQSLALDQNSEAHLTKTSTKHITELFDPLTGKMTSKRTDETEALVEKKSASVHVDWAEEMCFRSNKLQQLLVMPVGEAKGKSEGFAKYKLSIGKELDLFRTRVQPSFTNVGLTTGENGTVWTDSDFVLRFLFGMRNSWPKDTWRIPGAPTWLACLWTMEEMLQFCNDPKFLAHLEAQELRALNRISFAGNNNNDGAAFHAGYAENCASKEHVVCARPRFAITSLVMSGYVTGQLLVEHIPELQKLMRKKVLDEIRKPYFPQFKDFEVSDDAPASLIMSYDFHDVEAQGTTQVPLEHMRNCDPKDECYVLDPTTDVDGPLVRLFRNPELQKDCFVLFEQRAMGPQSKCEESSAESLLANGYFIPDLPQLQ